MKITKTPNDIIKENEQRRKANEGCLSCPTCGCNYIKESFMTDTAKGITRITFRVERGIFFKKFGNIDKYKCQRCGTEWESELY